MIIDSQVCSLSFLKTNRDSRSNCKNVHLRCLIFLNADLDIADFHITVNCISPGWIQTNDYERLRPEDHAQHPSRRVGKPEDIARMCLFLCQEENDFINGQNIIIDGGMTKKMIYLE